MDFDVVDLGPADHPEPGEEAPDFTRPLVGAEFWEDRALSSLYDEGPVLLLFHPMDGAFQATYAWKEVRSRGWTGRETGAGPLRVVGCSISTPYEHRTLLEERDVDARLFSDPTNAVAERYGVVNDLDGMTGVAEPRTATFLIDADGVIQYAWAASEHPDFPDYDAVEAAIDAL
jgi:peroxiredoxin